MSRDDLSPVPSHIPDPARCQATVLSSRGKQCTAKATTRRDGQPCCNRHKNSRWFVVWTPLNEMSHADAVRRYQRIVAAASGELEPPVRVVK
jgi:hypothetical protein